MNYINGDYFLGHLLLQARKKNLNKLEVDILENTAKPKELLTRPILSSISYWNKWFPELVETSGSNMNFVKSASMTIEFDLQQARPFPGDKNFVENPFTCEIKIIDDRGKEYNHRHEGWWYPESTGEIAGIKTSIRKLWKTFLKKLFS